MAHLMAKKLLTEAEVHKLLNDRIWRLSHMYKIKTKDKRLQILKPNSAQLAYLANETTRDIILKARQLGFSTLKLIELLDYAITTKNSSSAVIAHKKDTVQVLFEMVRLAYDNLPGPLKPRATYDNRNELYFPDLNSKIYVSMDTRGETVHNLHVSELAFVEGAEERMLGILESVPKDGIISFESTANGMTGYFFDVWEDQHSEFQKHFFNWTLDKDYFEVTSKSTVELADEYRPLQLQYGLMPDIHIKLMLSAGQFAWYINKVRRHKQKVMQEYPSTPLEAFIASGRNVFNFADLQKHDVKDPIDRKYSDLMIWEHPLIGFKYTIGCDPSEGVGDDNAVIEVMNAHTGEQVAELAANNIPPDVLGGYLLDIAKYYNNAYVVLEINNHGVSVMDQIKRKYLNVYRREVFDKISNSYKESLGWKTTLTTKPLLVDALEEAVRNVDVRVHSAQALSELKTFVRTDEGDKKGFGAEGSKKDDRVIALGLALQGIRHMPGLKAPKTIAQQKLDDFIQMKKLAQDFPNQPVINPRHRPRFKIRNH